MKVCMFAVGTWLRGDLLSRITAFAVCSVGGERAVQIIALFYWTADLCVFRFSDLVWLVPLLCSGVFLLIFQIKQSPFEMLTLNKQHAHFQPRLCAWIPFCELPFDQCAELKNTSVPFFFLVTLWRLLVSCLIHIKAFCGSSIVAALLPGNQPVCIFVVSPQTLAEAATIGSSVSQMLEEPKSEPESNPANTNTATNPEPVSPHTEPQVCPTVLHTLYAACVGKAIIHVP